MPVYALHSTKAPIEHEITASLMEPTLDGYLVLTMDRRRPKAIHVANAADHTGHWNTFKMLSSRGALVLLLGILVAKMTLE